jgi:hypothetical protein
MMQSVTIKRVSIKRKYHLAVIEATPIAAKSGLKARSFVANSPHL